ncbi:MAG: hypothetical protein E7166_02275 [Firmicutes bacterium]|nr:hypothetical protein [Bacillota bacterium]
MELKEFNKTLIDRYRTIENVVDLSAPLLVSTDSNYLNNISNSNNKVLYIGQETNGWINDINDWSLTQELIESVYLEVIKRKNNNEFFRFINNFSTNTYQNVIWSNTLIAGKKYGKGYPVITDKLQELSLENLVFLYKYFKPDITLFVSGPNNPYYEIIKEFLNIINSKIESYPKISNPVVYNKEENIFWTYHPNYLNMKHLKTKLLSKIKKQ